MRMEVEYSGGDTTSSVLKWIAVGVAPHVALRALVFVRTKLLSNFLSKVYVAHGCWLDNRGNEASCKHTTINYEGGANILALRSMRG